MCMCQDFVLAERKVAWIYICMHCISICMRFRLGKVARTWATSVPCRACSLVSSSNCQSRYVERRKRILVILFFVGPVFVNVNFSERNGLCLVYTNPFMASRDLTRLLCLAFPNAIVRYRHVCHV